MRFRQNCYNAIANKWHQDGIKPKQIKVKQKGPVPGPQRVLWDDWDEAAEDGTGGDGDADFEEDDAWGEEEEDEADVEFETPMEVETEAEAVEPVQAEAQE